MKILDVEVNLIANARQLWNDSRVYLVIVSITQLADAASTTLFMSVDGIESELNAIVRWLSALLGIVLGPLLGKSLQLIALILLGCIVPRLFRFLCWAVIVLNTVAVTRNIEHYWNCV